MNDNHEISDELLSKYISGQCTEAEEAEVLDYMAQDDENVDDLMAIASAIDAQKRADRLGRNKKSRSIIPWTAAASLLLLLGIAWFFSTRNGGLQVDRAPAFAQQDSIDLSDTINHEMLSFYEE